MSGVTQVPGTAVGPSPSNVKTATAVCTGGKKVIGGGFLVTGGGASVSITTSQATAVDTWTVVGKQVPNATSAWSLTAQAICATAS